MRQPKSFEGGKISGVPAVSTNYIDYKAVVRDKQNSHIELSAYWDVMGNLTIQASYDMINQYIKINWSVINAWNMEISGLQHWLKQLCKACFIQ